MDKKCQLFWCHKKYYAQGYCVAHYRAVKRFGTPFGKHLEEYQRIVDIIADAQLLSRHVLSDESLTHRQCRICHEIPPNHKENCRMAIAHRILDKTKWQNSHQK